MSSNLSPTASRVYSQTVMNLIINVDNSNLVYRPSPGLNVVYHCGKFVDLLERVERHPKTVTTTRSSYRLTGVLPQSNLERAFNDQTRRVQTGFRRRSNASGVRIFRTLRTVAGLPKSGSSESG